MKLFWILLIVQHKCKNSAWKHSYGTLTRLMLAQRSSQCTTVIYWNKSINLPRKVASKGDKEDTRGFILCRQKALEKKVQRGSVDSQYVGDTTLAEKFASQCTLIRRATSPLISITPAVTVAGGIPITSCHSIYQLIGCNSKKIKNRHYVYYDNE